MKIKSLSTRMLGAAFALAGAAAYGQSGGSFELKWSTVDNGGGNSRSGRFALVGTIGQPEAALRLISGNDRFKLEPGFWSSVTVVQIPGAPFLRITLIAGGVAVLSWPLGVTGFTLEETGHLEGLKSWSASPQNVMDTATDHTVTVPATGVVKYYRLMRP